MIAAIGRMYLLACRTGEAAESLPVDWRLSVTRNNCTPPLCQHLACLNLDTSISPFELDAALQQSGGEVV